MLQSWWHRHFTTAAGQRCGCYYRGPQLPRFLVPCLGLGCSFAFRSAHGCQEMERLPRCSEPLPECVSVRLQLPSRNSSQPDLFMTAVTSATDFSSPSEAWSCVPTTRLGRAPCRVTHPARGWSSPGLSAVGRGARGSSLGGEATSHKTISLSLEGKKEKIFVFPYLSRCSLAFSCVDRLSQNCVFL